MSILHFLKRLMTMLRWLLTIHAYFFHEYGWHTVMTYTIVQND